MSRRVAVSGMGCVTPLGVGVPAFLRGLEAGRAAVGPITLFDASAFRSGVGFEVSPVTNPGIVPRRKWQRLDRCDRMALVALAEALGDAGAGGTGALDVTHAALCCGLSTAGMFEAEQKVRAHPERGIAAVGPRTMLDTVVCSSTDVLLRTLGCRGPVHSVSTACSSAANALGIALDLVRDGDVDVAVAGGSDSLCRLTLAGFNSLGVVDAARPRPFDERRDGMVIGEGAAFLVLESEEHLRARGGEPELALLGYGCTGEAHHIVHPMDSGEGAARSMRLALADAGLEPGDVDHVNAHGTATIQNDLMEAAAIRAVFGDRTATLPVTSTKSLVGHTLGVSGAIEAVASLLTLRHGLVAPTAGHARRDPGCDLDVVHGAPRRGAFRTVISNSFAFGGADVSLVFGRWGSP